MNRIVNIDLKKDEMSQEELNKIFGVADAFLHRDYLSRLNEFEVEPWPDEKVEIRLYKIGKIVYDKKENNNDKLVSVYGSVQAMQGSILLVIDGQDTCVNYYLGVKRLKSNVATEKISTLGETLKAAFTGNFPGSRIETIDDDEASSIMQTLTNKNNLSLVNVVPSPRDNDKDRFVQGIEKFIDTMQGKEYTAVIIAESISEEHLQIRKRAFENLYSRLSPYKKQSLSYSESHNNSFTNSLSTNQTYSYNESFSDAFTEGSNRSFNFLLFSVGSQNSKTRANIHGNAIGEGTAKGKSEEISDGKTEGIEIEFEQKTVVSITEKIEEQLKRLNTSEGMGLWGCSAYFFSEKQPNVINAASTYKALMTGEGSSVEGSYISKWVNGNEYDKKNVKEIKKYLQHGTHPRIYLGEPYCNASIIPYSIVNGQELPLLIGIPHKAVRGLPVYSMAEFGRNVFKQQDFSAETESLELGNVFHMGEVERGMFSPLMPDGKPIPVELGLKSFRSHCFVTGSTGSGKSNTVYRLIAQILENNKKRTKPVSFLVIEPAKGEYSSEFRQVNNKKVNIYTTNPYIEDLLKINPFKFDEEILITEHLDRLLDIFNAAWEMSAAMPEILKAAIERSYRKCGWDLSNSINLKKPEHPEFPTFSDVKTALVEVINESDYSEENKGNYIGALVTRVSSLTNGIYGQIFCQAIDIPDKKLFDENTIIDLSKVGSSETKSLIMGIIIQKLTEYRMAERIRNNESSNAELRHVTILEEAHNILKNTHNNYSEGNLARKAVETICNAIAEVRTYGEGFIIVDQSPSAVDIAAIKNTNTKIIMRLPEKNDCEIAGHSVGLNEEQIAELTRLDTGVAIVKQSDWVQEVQVKVIEYTGDYRGAVERVSKSQFRKLRGAAVKCLIDFISEYVKNPAFLSLDDLLKSWDNTYVDISECKKNEIREIFSTIDLEKIGRLNQKTQWKYIADCITAIIGCENILELVRINIFTNKVVKSIDEQKIIDPIKAELNVTLSVLIDSDEKTFSNIVECLTERLLQELSV